MTLNIQKIKERINASEWHGLDGDSQTIIVRRVHDFGILVIEVPKRGDIGLYQYQLLEGDDTDPTLDYAIIYDFWDRSDERYNQRFKLIKSIDTPEDLKSDGDIHDLDALNRYIMDTVTQSLANYYYYQRIIRNNAE